MLPDLIRIIAAGVLLVMASRQDIIERKASDAYWLAGGTIAFILLEWELILWEMPLSAHFFCLGLIWIYLDIFWDREEIFNEEGTNLLPLILYAIAFLLMGYFVYDAWPQIGSGNARYAMLISVAFMVFFVYILFMFDVIKGGADAKALIMLSILFPHYPTIAQILPALPVLTPLSPDSWLNTTVTWEEIYFPFSFLVLMTGAMTQILNPLVLFIFNLVKGDTKLPNALFGYKMPIDAVEKRHVWLMERVEDGRIKVVLFPKDDDIEQIELLRGMGKEEVWVNPKIPFIVPITAGFLLTLVLGNILLLFLHVS